MLYIWKKNVKSSAPGLALALAPLPPLLLIGKAFLNNLTGFPILTLVPRKLITWNRIHFRSKHDIIYLMTSSSKPNVGDILQAVRTDKLDTSNIQRLTIDIKGFEQLLHRFVLTLLSSPTGYICDSL